MLSRHATTSASAALSLVMLAGTAPAAGLEPQAMTVHLPVSEIAGHAEGVLPAEGVLSLEIAGRRYDLAPDSAGTVATTGANVVRGGLLGEPGHFVLSEVRGFVSGAIWTEDGAVEFRPLDGTGRVSVVDIDATEFPPCVTPPNGDVVLRGPAGDAGVNAPRGDAPEQVVRVFVGITEAAQAQMGGPSGALSVVTSAIESTNAAYANSMISFGDAGLVQATIELAGTYVVDGGGLDAGGLLGALRDPDDGLMDVLHVLRDATKSDLVALISRSNIGACGIAYYAIDDPTRGFSVTAQSCAVGNLTFAHELGHNYGAAHDRANGGSGNAPYGFGWRWNASSGQLRRSVMAYSPGVRRPFFSNPDVVDSGGATGDAAEADNARLIGETFPLLASFRTGEISSIDDCNANGVIDILEIVLDPVLDSDDSGTLDSCDLDNGLLEDCNGDGIADIGQIRPRTVINPGPIVLEGFPPYVADLGEPIEAAGDVVISLTADADLGDQSEFIDVSLNGVPLGRFWETDGVDCDAGAPIEIVIDRDTWNSLAPPVSIAVQRSTAVNPYQCGANAVTATVEYTGLDRNFDADGDGVLDGCEPGCNAADLAEPFGTLDLADIGAFVAAFTSQDLAGDVNDDGVFDLGDIGVFAGAFNTGCN